MMSSKEVNPPVNPGLCPLCQQDNNCAVAQQEPASTCWCHKVIITQQALERIPAAASMRSCICIRCARAFSTEDSTTEQ